MKRSVRTVRSQFATSGSLRLGDYWERDGCLIHFEYAEKLYDSWPRPTCLIVDGPYGVSGFPGDQHRADQLAGWYTPHIEAWSRCSTPETTLWFWNTEVGWATVHPVLLANDWEYRCCYIWDKGMSHVSGNANTQTLRKFPVVTEVCAQYVKAATFSVDGRKLSMQEWLRYEWLRSGLPLRVANEACGVLNAATRKYLTADHLWYYPPPEMFERMVQYANRHGRPAGRPYFSLDGIQPMTKNAWAKLRAKFACEVGVTNVWREPQLNGTERIRGTRSAMRYKFTSLHGSQKPLRLIERIVRCCTDPGDVVWEPFGGLCPGAVVSHRLQRCYRAAEIVPEFYIAAAERLATYDQSPDPAPTEKVRAHGLGALRAMEASSPGEMGASHALRQAAHPI
ncbi:MAG TPA: DNA methyltransferase [Alphaproteobacteria bacterium]|nr:DNA methyltransferase [Alphaproteobacteria bacterium]